MTYHTVSLQNIMFTRFLLQTYQIKSRYKTYHNKTYQTTKHIIQRNISKTKLSKTKHIKRKTAKDPSQQTNYAQIRSKIIFTLFY